MKKPWLLIVCMSATAIANAQFSRDQISSDFVLYQRRVEFDRYMREKTINNTFAQPLDSNTEDGYREALAAISQFLLQSPEIEKGINKMFAGYHQLENASKRALLEAVYGVYPNNYHKEIVALVREEANPKLFSMMAAYLYRLDHGQTRREYLLQLLAQRFPIYQQEAILQELEHYLQSHALFVTGSIPPIKDLFRYQQEHHLKTIYSFQRWNRDYPGIAIIQNEDGRFARDSSGQLLVFRQLARSASDLPYFITNGSTPQGIFSIQGIAVSHNNMIGPTPNIQLVMPNEIDSVFWHGPYDSAKTALENYLQLLPSSWRGYAPMTESFNAGRIGRTEIIAHGTTIDPDYFKDKPYYPLTPTMGCLCAPENWNIFTGKFISSEQFNLANAFAATPEQTGYLFVINLDNQSKAVSREEIEKLVGNFSVASKNLRQ
jgi:hypothetical protein